METSNINSAIHKFNSIFNNKGLLAPFTESAVQNFKSKSNNPNLLYYFTIGHVNKHIDTKNLYGLTYSEEIDDFAATRFLVLQKKNFSEIIIKDIEKILNDIRNLNSHYIHTFDIIKFHSGNLTLRSFIKEAFELSSLITFLKDKDITASTFFTNPNSYEKKFVDFLCNMFLPKKPALEKQREEFLKLTKSQAIDEILFINNRNLIAWKINDHDIFDIQTGVYLSQNACIFLTNIFLYKDEAEKLLSRINGFKETETIEKKNKRDLFTFLSKKVSSQDIDHEANHLVRFRDIIQYLDKYPVAFNQFLECHQKDSRTKNLIDNIVNTEIERHFADDFEKEATIFKEKFSIYVKEKFFLKFNSQYKKYRRDIAINQEEITHFENVINESRLLKGERRKLKDLEKAKVKDIKLIELTKRKIEFEIFNDNPEMIKLNQRIQKNTFIAGYGRNQDRFIQFATRYLAEQQYFGKEAKFKCYQFYTTDEQNEFLEQETKIRDKKTIDKLKYHQGRLVHFIEYNHSLNKYPNWDTPFVEENNSIAIQVQLFNQTKNINQIKHVTIQRSLMIYLLEDALKNTEIKDSGLRLLSTYLTNWQSEYDIHTAALFKANQITDKCELAKFFPKKILHNFIPAEKNHKPVPNKFKQILIEAKKQETRFNTLLKQATDAGNADDFLKKNKGKQFKLRFIRKAWNILYFNDVYKQQVTHSGQHHKSFHITRTEFNNFCKWMYGLENVPQYKLLLEKLFNAKSFFQDDNFKKLFNQGKKIEDWYNKTKIIYENYLKEIDIDVSLRKEFKLENYDKIINDKMMFINLSHFIRFYKNHDTLRPYQKNGCSFLPNHRFLNDYNYQIDINTDRVLFNTLNKNKLEDSLLYEIAFRYLDIREKNIKKPLNEILKSDIIALINKGDKNKCFKLRLSFKQIDQLAGFQHCNISKDLSRYIEIHKSHNTLKPFFENFSINKEINYVDFKSLESHLISNSVKFTNLFSNLEKYHICKERHKLEGKNRIDLDDLTISYLKSFKKDRDNAFHFDVPNCSYDSITRDLISEFIKNEFNKNSPIKISDLNTDLKTIVIFILKTFHNHRDFKLTTTEVEKEKAFQKQYKENIYDKIRSTSSIQPINLQNLT